MSVLEDIKQEVKGIAAERELPEDRAFGFWFLERFEDLSPEDAEDAVVDGPWDLGRDAVYLDEDNSTLKIYQFKYSEDIGYVKGALKDIQNALKAENEQLAGVDSVELTIVTLATADKELHAGVKTARKIIKTWLSRNKYNVESRVELIDLKRFRQLYERLYGVKVDLEWKKMYVLDEAAIIGLVDAVGIKDLVDTDELFSFNVRGFLGFRKGSVSSKILKSLKDEADRKQFWVLNNGIVCLCTGFKPKNNKVEFENFTVVNGAQTLNTIATFLQNNPAVEEPIWVVAKVLRVRDEEIDVAAKITESSNTQNPTSSRDIKAIDPSHRWIEKALQDEFGIKYVYKRGQRAAGKSVKMKDVAQGVIAFWEKQPDISFARPGQIFANNDVYYKTFPTAIIDALKESGDKQEIRDFLVRLLLPWHITVTARDFIKKKTGKGSKVDRKFRSLTYHMTWLYRELLQDKLNSEGTSKVYAKINNILEKTMEHLFSELVTFLTYSKADIPKSLKSHTAEERIRSDFMVAPNFSSIKDIVNSM